MSTLSVHDLQGFSTYNNTIRIPSGHKLDVDGNLNIPVWTTATRPQSPDTGAVGYNTTIGLAEIYDGSSWMGLILSLIHI